MLVRTMGHDKGCYCHGRKFKPFVMFKGVHQIAALAKISGVVVNYSDNGWMNEELTVKWIAGFFPEIF